MKTASIMYTICRRAYQRDYGAYPLPFYEVRVLQGAHEYTLHELKSVKINAALASNNGIDVGNANSTVCKISIIEESSNWPRMAQFTVQFRIVSVENQITSEWITAGVFWTDERSEDKSGNLLITGYDAMLMHERTWTDKIPTAQLPATFPITAKAWATMIQNAGLANFKSLTQLDDTVAFVGLNTTSTIRDVLKSIAAVHAGNWTIIGTDSLVLIPFENVSTSETSKYVTLGTLGIQASQFETSPAFDDVSGVHLETDSGTVMEAGDDNGYVVKSTCSVSSTAGIADLCLSRIEGYVYKPFSAGNARLDPLVDLGDSVLIDEEMYQIMSIDWDFSKMVSANVGAQYDQEIDHEYTVPGEDTRIYRKAMSLVDEKMGDYVPWDEFDTAIVQNEQTITLVASHTFVTQTDFDDEIANIQSQLDGSIQTWSGNAVPTLNNAPASDWTTPALRAEHVGDTYFVNSDAGIPEAGQYYRFEVNNGVYSWQLMTDSAIAEALAQAAAALAAAEDAQDAADASLLEAQAKGRIFVVQPTPPYDVGDLWFKDTNTPIKVCMTARTSSESYVASDWVKRDMYIDETGLEAFLEDSELIQSIQNQLDQKIETYYQATDPAIDWGACIAGVAVAGIDTVGVAGDIASEHIGDLWYRTTDKATMYWKGTAWERQDVPEEVFDLIDGKAQVFITEPKAPYYKGDLWFDSAASDIKTCINERTTFGFLESDWEKRNKYTDDSATDALRDEVVAELQVQSDAITAKVSRTGGTSSSFGWVLNDTSHTWSANGEEVMSISQRDGLKVKGAITATSGFIGNASQGFEITATAIRNGMRTLSDTSRNGIYIGTDGIALGKGKFKVTNTGVITATSGTIGGFTITATSLYNGMTSFNDTTHDGVYIGTDGIASGKGSFQVTPQGDLYADNGYFLGLVQAKSIMSKMESPTFGTFNGGGLTEYSVSGGVGGQIGYTNNGGIIGANMEYSTITDAYTDNGINTSLGYANYAAGVFSGVQRANYLMASYVSASDQLIVGGYDVVWQYSSTLGGYVLMRSTN